MKKVIIFGYGSFAKTITYYIETYTDWEIVCYTTDLDDTISVFNGKEYYPFSYVLTHFSPEEHDIVMGIGYKNMNSLRQEKFEMIKHKGYHFPNFIHPSSIINNAQLGEGNFILENTVIEPNTVLGDNNFLWSAVLLGHDGIHGNNNHYAACSLVAGNCTIGNNCFLGNHATVKDGVAIADFSLLGAGVYVSKNTKKYDVVVPARAVTLENKKSTDFI